MGKKILVINLITACKKGSLFKAETVEDDVYMFSNI